MLFPSPSLRAAGCALVLAARILISANASAAPATPPRIDRIELLFTDLVTFHFDTEPNRRYELQFIDALPHSTSNLAASSPTTTWSNLFVAPAVPFPNHYIIADTRTNRHRFYRLRVTP